MKKNYYFFALLYILILGACHPTYIVQNDPAPAPAPAPEPEVSYQNFYDDLSPYGTWIDYPGYGYVWMPNAGPDFKPYATNGYWAYTDAGWAWASNYSWGWAPFHYGRWFYQGGYGWMWVPGQEWAPAWVSWRSGADYYGWAPLGPNVSISVGSYNPPSNYWCFVPHQYISSTRINNYYVNESRNVTIINNTTIINNRVAVNNNYRDVYSNGPDPREAERYTGSPIRPAVIRGNNRPGEQVNNGQYTIYRPRVNSVPQQTAGSNRPQRVAPSRVESFRDVRPTSTANTNTQPVNNNQPVNNTQPVIRNNNSATVPANQNNSRPVENTPAPNFRQQEAMNNSNNNNQPVNNRFNERNSVTPAQVNNNNQPVNPRNNEREFNNRSYNNNNNSQANNNTNVNPQPVARPSAISNRPANNNVQMNRPSSTTNNNANIRNNNNGNANQFNRNTQSAPQRRVSATNTNNAKPAVRPAEKKQEERN